MRIVNYYRGGTDKLTGFVYDTKAKTYREFSLQSDKWTREFKRGNNLYSTPIAGFKNPGDIDYFFPTLRDMNERLETIKNLGFKEDPNMTLDFGAFVLEGEEDASKEKITDGSITIIIDRNGDTPVTVEDDLLQVELTNIGEGTHGDYDENDEDDINFLRYYVNIKNDEGEWEEVEDASYCTCIDATDSIENLSEYAIAIHSRYRKEIDSYPVESSVKKLGEELSWIG